MAQVAFAAPSPMQLMQQVTDQTLSALRSNQASLHTNSKVVYGIIYRILLPHVDMQEMSKAVLGREVWTSSSADQKQKFIAQFKLLLIRTYASALAAYKNETVKFMPLRDNSGSRAQIDSLILQQGGPSIPVSYRLVLKGGQWKLYDLIVDGVSLVESYRSQFADGVARQGLDGVIIQLTQKNGSGGGNG
jgi:ABC-type transport system involved in resistance to organic solvents, auxiliary component